MTHHDPEPMATAADAVAYLLDLSPDHQRAALARHPEAMPAILAEALARVAALDAADPPSIAELLHRQADGLPIVPDDARDLDGGAS